ASSMSNRSMKAIDAWWLGCSVTDAATMRLVSRKTASAAIVVVDLFAAQRSARPLAAARELWRLPTLRQGLEPLPRCLDHDLRPLVVADRGELGCKLSKVV